MRIMLPNGEERDLDNDISIDKKKELCEELLLEFDADINNSWDTHPGRAC